MSEHGHDRHECDFASAKAARKQSEVYLAEAEAVQKGNTLDDSTSYRRFVGRAWRAQQARAELERRIARMYEGRRDDLEANLRAEIVAEFRANVDRAADGDRQVARLLNGFADNVEKGRVPK